MQVVISRWKPLTAFTAAIGDSAVGATVARDAPLRPPAPRRTRRTTSVADADAEMRSAGVGAAEAVALVRGSVVAFDAHEMRWQLAYVDGTTERVGVDLLNLRLQRRHAADAVGDGVAPSIGADASELDELLAGIHAGWAKGRIK